MAPRVSVLTRFDFILKNASLLINKANIESQTFGLTALLLPSLHSYRLLLYYIEALVVKMFKTLQCNHSPFHLKFEHFDVTSVVLIYNSGNGHC